MRAWIPGLMACSVVAAGCGGDHATASTGVTATQSSCPSPGPPDPVPLANAWTWEAVNAPFPEVESIFVDPEDERTLYAGGVFPGLYASGDGGASWHVAVTGAVNTNAVAFLPESSCTVFAAGGDRLQRSDDRGRTWRVVRWFPEYVRSIHVGRDSRHIYVGPQVNPRESQSPDGIWVSADLGATWSLSPLPTAARGLIPWDIEEDVSGVLYTGTEIWDHPQPYRAPYYRSLDSGRTWEDVTGALPSHVSNTAAHPTRAVVYALTEGVGLYVTEDQGLHWSRRGTSDYALELILDPHFPEVLYAGDHTLRGARPGGAYASTDEGRTFHPIGLEGRIVGSLALNGTGSRLYAASYLSGLSRATVPSPR